MAEANPALGLTEAQQASFRRDGYVLIPGILSPDEATAYRQRLQEYAFHRTPVPEGVNVQMEPRVARGEVQAGNDLESIRKIERLVGRDPMFTELTMHPRIVAIMQSLLGPDLKLFRDAVLMKPPHTGSPKGMHQDAPYWTIEPQEEVSCWMPFDPATLENGCMTAIPGSHVRGPVPHVSVTDDYVVPQEQYRSEDVVAVPMQPGDGLIFHALVLHATGPNRSDQPRRAITMSYMAAASRYTGKAPKPEYLRISGRDVPGGV